MPRLAALVALALTSLLSSAQAADQVRIGIARTMSDSGYYIADALGFFRDEGIEVTLTGFKSAAQMIAPLGSGELDVGGGTVSAGLYNAVARGINLKVVADQASMKPGYGYSSLMVRKDLVDGGRYKTFADLKGMKVAIGAPGTGTASALNETLKRGGLKYADVEVVYLGFPEHLPAYRNKAIDASITNEPTMTRAIEEGAARAHHRQRRDLSGPADRGGVLRGRFRQARASSPSASCAPICAACASTTTRSRTGISPAPRPTR